MADPDDTKPKGLMRAAEIGKNAGLRYIYAGNLPGRVGDLENTRCANCGGLLIRRYGYFVEEYRVTASGSCRNCGEWCRGDGRRSLRDRLRTGRLCRDGWWRLGDQRRGSQGLRGGLIKWRGFAGPSGFRGSLFCARQGLGGIPFRCVGKGRGGFGGGATLA